jgi:methylated-DNA-[protein]-cysteine S-methyltransferase
MTLRFGKIQTPIGDLLAVLSDGALVRLAFPEEDTEAVLESTADRLGGSPREGDVSQLYGEMQRYFSGKSRSFDTPWSLELASEGFTRRVLEATASVPYGAVATYGEMASRAGSPRGARAAGNALNSNPVPVVVPCHRVVPSSGGIGGYGGREDRKEALLRLEGAIRPPTPDPDA